MNIFKKMQTAHMANQVKRELERVIKSIEVAADECEYDKDEMLNWPKWPYMLITEDDEEYVCTLDNVGKKNLMLFITEEEAKQFGCLFEAMTKQKCKVTQPEKLLSFKRDCVLTIHNCGFEMWYGTYKSHTFIEEFKSMRATGLI
jgi:hypothetical protein